jgi:hypothetical protein
LGESCGSAQYCTSGSDLLQDNIAWVDFNIA